MTDAAEVCGLYRRYAGALHAVRAEQRDFLAAAGRGFTAQLDDIEAEITYLLLRARRPDLVAEIGTLHGWSTSWILRALRDNGSGRLRSYDISDRVCGNVPAALGDGRWEFTQGDARHTLPALPDGLGYLFVDADHGVRFARWYLAHLLEPFGARLDVSVHDVFHGRRARPFSEGRVVLDWLAARGTAPFTAARRRDRAVFERIAAVRREIGITADLRTPQANPMIYFTLEPR